jgi:hypothetical protein
MSGGNFDNRKPVVRRNIPAEFENVPGIIQLYMVAAAAVVSGLLQLRIGGIYRLWALSY